MRLLDETQVEAATCAGRRDVVPRQVACTRVRAAEVAGSAVWGGNDLGICVRTRWKMEEGRRR